MPSRGPLIWRTLEWNVFERFMTSPWFLFPIGWPVSELQCALCSSSLGHNGCIGQLKTLNVDGRAATIRGTFV